MRAYLCTPGFEVALIDELSAHGVDGAKVVAPGVVMAAPRDEDAAFDAVFARQQLPRVQAIAGGSIKALAEAAYAATEAAVDRWAGPLALHTIPPPRVPTAALAPGRRRQFRQRQLGVTTPAPPRSEAAPTAACDILASRARYVGRSLDELFAQRRRRAHRRIVPWTDLRPSRPDWLLVQVLLLTPDTALVSAAPVAALDRGATDLSPWPGGAAPIPDDRRAPSRAYRKLEEAFAWMDRAPIPGERCLDLGAAPGGWTHRALARGASVTAVDRADILPPTAHSPRLTTERGDAFSYAPRGPFDWVLCDVIADAARTVDLVTRFIDSAAPSALVATLKLKGNDHTVVRQARATLATRPGSFLRLKHLAANHHEVTVMWMR